MNDQHHRIWLLLLSLAAAGGIGFLAKSLPAQSPAIASTEPGFTEIVQPFFRQNCVTCHNSDQSIAGVRVDQLDPKMEDRQIDTWESVRRRVRAGTMPPKGLPQPPAADRERVVAWIGKSLDAARLRPGPKNGLVRR